MDSSTLEKKFAAMGARLRVNEMPKPLPPRDWRGRPVNLDALPRLRERVMPRSRVTLNYRNGEFIFAVGDGVEMNVVNIDPKDQHLLLHVNDNGSKGKYLCGHDERDWFIATVVDNVTTVRQAKESLQPTTVREATKGVRNKHRLRRRNAAFVRQGEWFFTPDLGFVPEENFTKPVHRNEPISRGGGSKAHIVEFLYRDPGSTVYVSGRRVLSPDQYNALPREEQRRTNWVVRSEVNAVWAKGRVSHPDHATITLDGWHRVQMNAEQLAGQGSSSIVSFID